ncbi:aminoglycoside phosphotransferase [Grosmannia clavigera kw1407]|uniref:Aminoglycoside phosphotransferase n=1 Tax=Grosmannia clavigera (strain kw1407 / UAMH 11150) TaxID=655863 RepID=F0XDK8_GROCL|nr:aminoglycoside phosphotransferase [Grosmannia clavigera kw1407]EFX03958.1 aminoglycoside phosphotransferase [Grosmannia clavigera kw1407]
MADTVVLPRLPEDVTAEWLCPKIGLTRSAITNKRLVTGTATLVLMTVTPEDEDNTKKRPMDLCVKGGLNPAMLSQFPFILSLYAREVDFYTNVAPHIPYLSLPHKLWAHKNTENAVIIMEDIAATGGFVFADPVDTWPVNRVMLVVEQLAALHGATWGTKATDTPWLDDHYDTSVLGLCGMWDAIVLAEDRPPVPAYMKDQRRMTAAIKTWFSTRNPKFRCILHGDAHLGNAAWSDRIKAPMLVDWQIIHLGSCFTDIAYFVMTALTIEDRRKYEMDIFDYYLQRLHVFGGPKLSRKNPEVMEEYRKSSMAGFSWVLCPYTMQKKERVWAIVERLVAAMEDHDPVSLLERE